MKIKLSHVIVQEKTKKYKDKEYTYKRFFIYAPIINEKCKVLFLKPNKEQIKTIAENLEKEDLAAYLIIMLPENSKKEGELIIAPLETLIKLEKLLGDYAEIVMIESIALRREEKSMELEKMREKYGDLITEETVENENGKVKIYTVYGLRISEEKIDEKSEWDVRKIFKGYK